MKSQTCKNWRRSGEGKGKQKWLMEGCLGLPPNTHLCSLDDLCEVIHDGLNIIFQPFIKGLKEGFFTLRENTLLWHYERGDSLAGNKKKGTSCWKIEPWFFLMQFQNVMSQRQSSFDIKNVHSSFLSSIFFSETEARWQKKREKLQPLKQSIKIFFTILFLGSRSQTCKLKKQKSLGPLKNRGPKQGPLKNISGPLKNSESYSNSKLFYQQKITRP